MDDPSPYGNLIFQLVLLFVLILVNAFFAMSEIAIISLNDNKIDKMAENGHKKAQKVLRLTKNSSNFLSTIQIGVTLAGFLTSASAAQSFSDRLAHLLSPLQQYVPASVINGVCVVIITLVISYFSLVIGELAPKRIAMQIPEKVSFAVVGPLLFISKVCKPFVKFLSFSTNCLVRLFGFDPNANDETVTEEEIRMMVDVGEEKGVIEDSQREMINNIFEFDDINAGDIMTHRTDIEAVEVDDPLNEMLRVAMEAGVSRIPVYEEELDNIIGLVFVKDLLPLVGKHLPEHTDLRTLVRPAHFVPETIQCGKLFQEMSEKHIQMAIVVDEYGGTAGLITMEDLLESIVGNIQDEYDNEDEEFSKIDETTYTFDGVTDIEEVSDILNVQIPQGDYDTLGGFVIDLLSYLPTGEETEPVVTSYENLTFTVLSVEDRRIGKIKVEITPAASREEKKKGSKKEPQKEES